MKQCKQKSSKKYHPKRKVQTKRGLKKHISANKKVSKVPTKNSEKHLNEIKNKIGEKNNQQKEDSRRKMQEYNSNIVITNIRIKDDRSPFCV